MVTNGFGLGRNVSPKDNRDYRLGAFLPMALGDLSGGRAWPFSHKPLDQGATPHCGGFGAADYGINDPVEDSYTDQDGHDFYYKCKIEDLEPGMENGTCVRSVAKVLQNAGRIQNYAFAASVDEITYWLLNNGPIIVGTGWTEGMFTPDEKNIIHPTGGVAGGHCYLLNEKTSDGFYGIQNSWNSMWGVNGKAYISITDFDTLFRDGGEAITAVELPIGVVPTPQSKGCNFILSQILAVLSKGKT
jgi:hypothetical protein